MNNAPDFSKLSPEDQEAAKKVVAIVEGTRDAILSGWQKISKLTQGTDFLSILEPGDQDTSISILPRETGLMMLGEKGVDVRHPRLTMIHEPATGLTPESSAIWIVVLFGGKTHVTKLVHQPMSQAGSA